MAESGFAEAAAAIRQTWLEGDREGATRLVPDDMVQALSLAGTAADSRGRLEAYRPFGCRSFSRSAAGRKGKGHAIRACAP